MLPVDGVLPQSQSFGFGSSSCTAQTTPIHGGIQCFEGLRVTRLADLSAAPPSVFSASLRASTACPMALTASGISAGFTAR